MKELKLQDLKEKSASELIEFAKENGVENASSLRKQELYFAILQNLADQDIEILGQGVIEVLQDGFGFLRSSDANYLPGPDDIYISPSQIRKFSLRTGDTVEGYIRGPKEGERYFALVKVNLINFEDPKNMRTKVHFDNLTPLYPDEALTMEILDVDKKDLSDRIIDIVAPLGKGQRAMIVSPPRTGKTVLLQNIANSITNIGDLDSFNLNQMLSGNFNFFFLLVPFAATFFSTLLIYKEINGLEIKALITSRKKIDFNRIFFGFLVASILIIINILIQFLLNII